MVEIMTAVFTLALVVATSVLAWNTKVLANFTLELVEIGKRQEQLSANLRRAKDLRDAIDCTTRLQKHLEIEILDSMAMRDEFRRLFVLLNVVHDADTKMSIRRMNILLDQLAVKAAPIVDETIFLAKKIMDRINGHEMGPWREEVERVTAS